MTMPTPAEIRDQINRFISCLVETGLSNDENFAFLRQRIDGFVEIAFSGSEQVAVALKDRAYDQVHRKLLEAGAYNARLLDGALIQMSYEFSSGVLRRHRLAFFPAPQLEDFQNNPEIYLDDEVYADVTAKSIVPFPVRFDYDTRTIHDRTLDHPKSHLTLGQYRDCRIPVTSPMTPFWFLDFVLRNFYHTAFGRYADSLPSEDRSFPESIRPAERSIVHMVIPA